MDFEKSLKAIPQGGSKQAKGQVRKVSTARSGLALPTAAKLPLAVSSVVRARVPRGATMVGGGGEGLSQHPRSHPADRTATTGT